MWQKHFEYHTIDETIQDIPEIAKMLAAIPHRDALLIIFTTAIGKSDFERLLPVLDHLLPDISRVGISEYPMLDNTPETAVKLNLILAKETRFTPVQIPCLPGSECAAADQLSAIMKDIPDIKGVLLYPSNPSLDITAFLRIASDGCGDIPFFGASALPMQSYETDHPDFGNAFCIGQTACSSGFSTVILSGAELSVHVEYILGWQPIGREMAFTLGPRSGVGESTVHTIDRQPAIDIYQKYLGVGWDEHFVLNVCEFPLMVERNGMKICMVPFRTENGDLFFAGPLYNGERLRFSYCTHEELLGATESAANRMTAFEPDALILTLCGNRIRFLRDQASTEWHRFQAILPDLTYSHGNCELFYQNGKGGVLNSAFVAFGMHEHSRCPHPLPGYQLPETAGIPDQNPIPLSYRVSHFFHVMTEELVSLEQNLENEVRLKTQENENLALHVVMTLADAIDAKDTYTNGHSARVAQYSREIARRYGYTQRQQNAIYIMGLLHDVGKIGVPDAVINKPSRLTDEEFALIKTHPAVGARILGNIREMPLLATGAHWHHERYDGHGYPDGLKGTDIPEEARIIGVADAYDAMTSNRSYRGSMPQSTVREQIVKGRGTQFDPVFADIMLKMIDEDRDYTMRET
ncbi:MAG: HD domain-containing protein [Clostridia bacterium]|nr:HD domain-containing protein [Clostridia bacterium]